MQEKGNLSTWSLSLPVLLLLSALYVAWYMPIDSPLAIGLTLDFCLSLPLLYGIVIYKTSIPKTTVVPVFLLGVVLSTWLIPGEEQGVLDGIKTWCLPLVELTVMAYVLYKVFQIRKLYKAQESTDFYSQVLGVTEALFPKRISHFMAAELSVPYYCFGMRKQRDLKAEEFSYHKKSGTTTVLWAFLMIILVETFVMHLLLSLWSILAAWILTILSLYTCLQILGLIRSMVRRPIEIKDQYLWLKYGTFGDAKVDLSNIKALRVLAYNERTDNATPFSFLKDLEHPNVLLELEENVTLSLAFGLKKETKKVVFFVDEVAAFLEAIKAISKLR